MQQIIEQLANDTGIACDEANYIFIAITSHLVYKIPALQQVIEDVFANVDPEKLREHINKLAILLQKQGMDKFKTWQMPQQAESSRQSGSDQIL